MRRAGTRQRDKEYEVDVAGEVGHELDDGHLVHGVVDGDADEEPERREEDDQQEEAHHLPAGPVEVAVPDALQVLLDDKLGDDQLLLVLDQNVDVLLAVGVDRF